MTRSILVWCFIFTIHTSQSIRAGEPAPIARTVPTSNGSWSYYGLTGGPTVVTFPPCESNGRPYLARLLDRNNPGYSIYIPPEPSFGPTAPRTLRLGWLTYSTPSPRGASNVSVKP